MLIKIIIILGGIGIVAAIIYDRVTGKKVTRRVIWLLGAALIMVIIAIAIRSYLR